MEDRRISFKTSELIKKFNIISDKEYVMHSQIEGFKLINSSIITIGSMHYYAPTQSLLQKWLREVHNIHTFSVIEPYSDRYRITVYNKNRENYTEHPTYYKSYEEALEIGLQEALKLIP